MLNIKDRAVSVTVSLPARVEHAVFERAEARGVSRSEMITDLLIRALEAEKPAAAAAPKRVGA